MTTTTTNNDLVVTGNKNSLIAPHNFEHYYRIANMMSKSDMVPKAYKDKPQDILIAMEMGVSLGLSPLQAIQNIAVINGKPCLYGDGMLAVCSGRPDFENISEEPIINKDDDKGKTIGYKCTVTRKGRSPVSKSFTIEQAIAAGLWGKQGPWKLYPDRMLQMRARGFALRDSFADALGGVRMAEEVQDYEIKDITPSSSSSEASKTAILNIKDLIAGKTVPSIGSQTVTVNHNDDEDEDEEEDQEDEEQIDKETGEVKVMMV